MDISLTNDATGLRMVSVNSKSVNYRCFAAAIAATCTERCHGRRLTVFSFQFPAETPPFSPR